MKKRIMNFTESEMREYVKILQTEFGFTIQEIAEEMKVNRSQLSHWFHHPNEILLSESGKLKIGQGIYDLLFDDGLASHYERLADKARTVIQIKESK